MSNLNSFGRFLTRFPRVWPFLRYTLLPVSAAIVAIVHAAKHVPEFIADYRAEVAEFDAMLKALTETK